MCISVVRFDSQRLLITLNRNIQLTEDGTEQLEKLLIERGLLETENLYDGENTQVVHHVDQALRAVHMFKRDTDYIVKDDKVVIIDEFTGRMMEGRRWSNGLHQAVEAKEGVKIEPENQTLASITFQNYFRMYPKLSGMTGTAATEAAEFWDIYKMKEAIRSQQAELDAKSATRRDAGATWKTRMDRFRKPGAEAEAADKSEKEMHDEDHLIFRNRHTTSGASVRGMCG